MADPAATSSGRAKGKNTNGPEELAAGPKVLRHKKRRELSRREPITEQQARSGSSNQEEIR